MAEQRLPLVNGDDGQWGAILNQFLSKEHYNDTTNNPLNGGHQTITIRPGTATAGTAPLKFQSGSPLTTPEAGAVEFSNDSLFVTQTTSTTRKTVAMYDDNSGATGDLHYRDASGYFVRLPIGASTNVLSVSAGLPAWVAPTSGGGASGLTPVSATISTATTASNTAGVYYVYFVAAVTTLTLPTAVSSANLYTVKNTSTGTVTVATTSSQTIDGSTTITLVPYQSVDILSDNTNWQLI